MKETLQEGWFWESFHRQTQALGKSSCEGVYIRCVSILSILSRDIVARETWTEKTKIMKMHGKTQVEEKEKSQKGYLDLNCQKGKAGYIKMPVFIVSYAHVMIGLTCVRCINTIHI